MESNNAGQVQSAGTLNLFQKLVEVRKSIGSLHKDANGYNNNYQYVTGSQILSKIQDAMNYYNVLLFPKVLTQELSKREYTTKYGKNVIEYTVFGEMTFTWIDADNPTEQLEVPFAYAGSQDDMARALGSALTYAERYFLIKSFNLPTDGEDPDGNQYNQHKNYNNQKNYHQQKSQQQSQQQQYRNPQPPMQQQPARANKDGEKLITEVQSQKLKNALKIVAGPKVEDKQTAFESACYACNIPEGTSTKALTFTQASGVLIYFDGLVKSRQKGGA